MGPPQLCFKRGAGDADAHGGQSEDLLKFRVCEPEGTAERRDELSDCGDFGDGGSEDLPQSGVSVIDGSEGDMDLEEG